MRPDFEKIVDIGQRSFNSKMVIRKNRPSLSNAWHFHPELEICYTAKSKGMRYVGNRISNYREEDLVILGANLPHGFTTLEECKQVVIQFKQEFLGQEFILKPELVPLKRLFQRASMGLEITGATKIKVIDKIDKLMESNGIHKLLCLLEILTLMAESSEQKTICAKEYSSNINLKQLSRIRKIFDFIEKNYQREINISEAASSINLTDSAFFKFINRHTKKKFTQIVNEYRVNHATKKLMNTQMTISEICFDSGYKNLSYFNRKFKESMGRSPSQFRNLYSVNL